VGFIIVESNIKSSKQTLHNWIIMSQNEINLKCTQKLNKNYPNNEFWVFAQG